MTMMSAGATGSLTTSAHPAARKTGTRTEGTATMAAAADATSARGSVHVDRQELMSSERLTHPIAPPDLAGR
jgi:hypothetical protein